MPPLRVAEVEAALNGRRAHSEALGRARTASPEAKIVDGTFHTLRHTFASWFVIRVATWRSSRCSSAHATITMTMKYAHLAPDHGRR